MALQWTVTQEQDSDLMQSIREMIRAHRRSNAPDGMFGEGDDVADYQPINVFLRDADDNLIGAIIGAVFLGTLNINYWWVDKAHRRKGYGRELLRRAIAEAQQHDCTYAWWNTWKTHQAYPIYDKLGATCVYQQEFSQDILYFYRLDFAG